MSMLFQSRQFNTKSHTGDQSLVKQLTDLIRQNVPYSKRLDVLGILSYTTDNDCEKFIKIDSSFSTTDEDETTKSKSSISLQYNTELTLSDAHQTEDSDTGSQGSENQTHLVPSPGASPPTLPPSVIRVGRLDDKLDRKEVDSCLNKRIFENLGGDLELNETNFNRRDRRKCRKPKRQLIDSKAANNDSEPKDVDTDAEESGASLKSTNEDKKAMKIPRLDSEVTENNIKNDDCILNSPSVSTVIASPSFNSSIVCTSIQITTLNSSITTNSIASSTNFSFMPVSCATINRYVTPQISTIDLPVSANNINSTSKYAISAKTLGLGDLGELCGILPLSALLNKSIISGCDPSGTSKLLFANTSGVTTPVSSSISENAGQTVLTSQCNSYLNPNLGANQNVLLNPTLAAAVAAAINSPVGLTNSSNTAALGTNLSGSIPALTGPSIALTGPSGELLGTIPIASGGTNQSIISNALANNQINNTTSLAAPVNSVHGTMSVSLNNGSPALANTLNWLRCAPTLTDSGTHHLVNNLNPINTTPSFSLTSSNPVALLQSLVTQQQQQQQQQTLLQQANHTQLHKQQSLPSTFSVGPTLALIGTLGLNSSSVPNSSTASAVIEATSQSSGLNAVTPISTNINTNTTTSSGNNSAALVAALLRSLANAKQINQESGDASNVDGNSYNIPASLTLITNNLPSSINVVSSTRTNLMSFDDPNSSVGSILNSKANSTTMTASLNNSAILTSNCTTTPTRTFASPQPVSVTPQGAVSRNSIMLSYPRGTAEMNLLLTPASAHTFSPSPLTPLAAVPTALSFQGLSTSQASNLTLASPVLFHAPVSSSITQTTTVYSDTTSTAPQIITPSVATGQCDKPLQSVTSLSTTKTTGSESTPVVSNSDPTASAIDRILQTIKGCMNASNSESEHKIKIISSGKKTEINSLNSSRSESKFSTHDSNEPRKLNFKSNTANASNKGGNISNESGYNSRSHNNGGNSASTNDRLPLPPLHRNARDSSENSIPVSKVYRCRYCGKTFNRKFCRERHERLHTGVKPYTCEICDEKFIRLEDKKRHVRSLQHYLSGRSTLVKAEPSEDHVDESVCLKVEPSTVLPLLAQTLQSNGNMDSETVVKAVDEVGNPTEDINGMSQVSEDGSEEIDKSSEVTNDANHSDDNDLRSDGKSSKLVVDINAEPRHFCDDLNVSNNNEVIVAEPSLDLLNNLRLSPKVQLNHKSRCRSALKETQPNTNHISESACEVFCKIPTITIIAKDEDISAKLTKE